jgi:membrane-associated protease RseP (regulator of RpoE activity)
MGILRSEFPDFDDRRPSDEEWHAATAHLPLPPPVRRREPIVRVVVLFLLTLLTTTVLGTYHYLGFQADFATDAAPAALTAGMLLSGFWYSASILAILGAHELGHYFACRYYRVDASLPYFLPAPLLTGTFGAFIRIRQPIASKRQLFDIGIAGPIAGFVVAVPLLLVGISLSRVAAIPPDFVGLELGEPLLFRVAAWLLWPPLPDGHSINMHPMAFAAWFGLLATALNLFPVGQLDGGHISYAVLGQKSTAVTLATVACLIGLAFVSLSWVVWAVLIVAMMLVFGPRHPSTADEDEPLDRTRLWLAAFAVLMFVLCFTPAPIELWGGN